jgi:tRNA (adenine57-N1/adenine58-N1)-methyltransferase
LLIHSSGKTLTRDWRGEDVHTTWGSVPGVKIREAVDNGKAVRAESSKGEHFLVLKPLLRDRIQNAERGARPLYEYDAAVAAALMSLQSGMDLLEAGTGSGCATMLFAQFVFPGRVVSFEQKERLHAMAKENIEEAGIKNAELRNEDLFDASLGEDAFDAVFLDLLEDAKAVKKTAPALKLGGFMCVFSPVEAKVSGIVQAMGEQGFVNVEIVSLGSKRRSVMPGKNQTPWFPGFFVCGRKF